jgi:hypothetical protein
MDILSYCGDNCTYCPRYVATQSGSIDELEKAKDLWVRLGFRDNDFPVQEMACTGCGQKNACAYVDLRACVSEKGLDNCGYCHDYLCDLTNAAFEETERLRSRAVNECSKEEMDILDKAFFLKKQYFDKIHQKEKD